MCGNEIEATGEEIKFSEYIVKDNYNKKGAYQKVFPKCTELTSEGGGSRIYSRPIVKILMNDMRMRLSKHNSNKKDMILMQLERVIKINHKDLYDDEGKRKPISEIDIDTLNVCSTKNRNRNRNWCNAEDGRSYEDEEITEISFDPKIRIQAIKEYAEISGIKKTAEEDIDDEDDIINEKLGLIDKD